LVLTTDLKAGTLRDEGSPLCRELVPALGESMFLFQSFFSV